MWGDKRRRLQVAAVLTSTALSAVAFALLNRPHRGFDVKVYRGAVDFWAHGGDL
jgi:hypothetical protein